MNIYVVKRIITTPAKFSIDGKKHRKTNYYQGMDLSLCGMINWCGSRKMAYKFTNKKEAETIAKKYNCEVIKLK